MINCIRRARYRRSAQLVALKKYHPVISLALGNRAAALPYALLHAYVTALRGQISL